MSEVNVEDLSGRLEEFLKELVGAGRFNLKFLVTTHAPSGGDEDSPALRVEWDGKDTDLLLARRGEMLTALEYLAGRALHLSQENQRLIFFDCRDFRLLLQEEIRLMAETAAEQVERTGTEFALGPMNSHDRRLVHLALKERAGIRTESEGGGPGRKVVIYPVS